MQENPFVVLAEEETSVFWADNRASAGNGRQVFMQRFDVNGAPLLAENGVRAMQVNGNLNGFPRALVMEDGTHIVTLYSTAELLGGTPGFRAGRVTNTGANLWSDTTRFCTPELGPNGGTDYGIVLDDHDGVVAVWFNYQNDALYAARIESSGALGGNNSTSIARSGSS